MQTQFAFHQEKRHNIEPQLSQKIKYWIWLTRRFIANFYRSCGIQIETFDVIFSFNLIHFWKLKFNKMNKIEWKITSKLTYWMFMTIQSFDGVGWINIPNTKAMIIWCRHDLLWIWWNTTTHNLKIFGEEIDNSMKAMKITISSTYNGCVTHKCFNFFSTFCFPNFQCFVVWCRNDEGTTRRKTTFIYLWKESK